MSDPATIPTATPTSAEPADPPVAPLGPFPWQPLTAGAVACLIACAVLAAVLNLPVEPGFGGSLLVGYGPAAAVGKFVGIAVVAAVVGSLLAASAEVEGGLFCAAAGLAAVAVRCGPIRPVLAGAGRGVFAVLAVETVLLTAAVAGIWYAVRSVVGRVRPRAARVPMANELADPTTGQRLGTLGTQMLATAVGLLVLVPDAAHPQTLGGVGVAAFLAAIVAYSSTPLAEGVWYWAGPAAVGVVGYVLAIATGSSGLPVGDVQGWAAALARPTPLDYATLGTAGALFGYWTARRMYEVPPEPADGDGSAVSA